MNPAPAAGEFTRDEYRDRMANHVFRLLGEPHPGGRYAPYPGDGIHVFLNFAALAVAYCTDDELHDLGEVVFKAATKSHRKAPSQSTAAVFPFRVIRGGADGGRS